MRGAFFEDTQLSGRIVETFLIQSMLELRAPAHAGDDR